jgi:hypothetical protein
MKKNVVTVISYLVVAVTAIPFIYACTQHELSPGAAVSEPAVAATGDNGNASQPYFHKGVGAPIDGALGRKWVANYEKAVGHGDVYTIAASELQLLLDRGAIGISLHYALDDMKQLHVLPMGVDAKGNIMKATSVPTITGSVDWATAQQWIGHHTGEIRAHFFGADVYVRLLKELKGDAVTTTLALNDSGALQLLMSDAAVDNPENVYDASWVCPTVCPGQPSQN